MANTVACNLSSEPGAAGRNGLLSALPPADLAALTPHLVDAPLERGTVLQEAGQPIRRVYFLHSGLVSLLGMLPDGYAVDTATIGREGGVGLSAGLGSQLGVSQAVVQVAGHASQIMPVRLAELAVERKAVRDMLVRYTDLLLAQVQQSVACNTVHHVQERLCRWLRQAHARLGGDPLPLTQEFLSGMLGVQRTTVTAICRMLQAEGILDVRRGRIHVHDFAALQSKACACYGVVRDLTDRLTR